MKNLIKILLRLILLLPLVLAINRGLRWLVATGYRLQFWLQWRAARHQPERFDQKIDQYWIWPATRDPSAWERGILGRLVMRKGCRVLDLCCGDGFYSYYFYSSIAGHVLAMDFDADGIGFAKRNCGLHNLEFCRGDVRSEMPEGPFDNVCWDAGIEYFTPEEPAGILNGIKARLTPEGVLSGCGIIATEETRSHASHKFEFCAPEDLKALLQRHFANVTILQASASSGILTRRTFHFFASDGASPLMAKA